MRHMTIKTIWQDRVYSRLNSIIAWLFLMFIAVLDVLFLSCKFYMFDHCAIHFSDSYSVQRSFIWNRKTVSAKGCSHAHKINIISSSCRDQFPRFVFPPFFLKKKIILLFSPTYSCFQIYSSILIKWENVLKHIKCLLQLIFYRVFWRSSSTIKNVFNLHFICSHYSDILY